ncbi:hypothetical protein pb186bvf_017550 [Paramecium bursaria]
MQKSQDNLESLLKESDLQAFKKVKVYVQLLYLDENKHYQQMIIGAIQNGIRQQVDHVFYLYSLRLAKEAIETFQFDFIEQFEQQLLSDYERIALWRFDQPDRKNQLFSINPTKEQQIHSQSSLVLLLEEIKVWAIWFPKNKNGSSTKFYQLYEKLLDQGVQFPGFQYFKQDQVLQKANYNLMNKDQVIPKQQIDDIGQQEERDNLMKKIQELTYLNDRQKEIIDQQNQIIQNLTNKENKNEDKLMKFQQELQDCKEDLIKRTISYEKQLKDLMMEINQLRKN